MFHCSILELISFVPAHTFDATMTAERLSSPVRWAALWVAVLNFSRSEGFLIAFLGDGQKGNIFHNVPLTEQALPLDYKMERETEAQKTLRQETVAKLPSFSEAQIQ